MCRASWRPPRRIRSERVASCSLEAPTSTDSHDRVGHDVPVVAMLFHWGLPESSTRAPDRARVVGSGDERARCEPRRHHRSSGSSTTSIRTVSGEIDGSRINLVNSRVGRRARPGLSRANEGRSIPTKVTSSRSIAIVCRSCSAAPAGSRPCSAHRRRGESTRRRALVVEVDPNSSRNASRSAPARGECSQRHDRTDNMTGVSRSARRRAPRMMVVPVTMTARASSLPVQPLGLCAPRGDAARRPPWSRRSRGTPERVVRIHVGRGESCHAAPRLQGKALCHHFSPMRRPLLPPSSDGRDVS